MVVRLGYELTKLPIHVRYPDIEAGGCMAEIDGAVVGLRAVLGLL